MKSGKTKPKIKPAVKKLAQKKSPTTKAQLEKRYRGAKSDAMGLRYEQTVANYFIQKGWNPRHRVSKYGYEYDLYAEKSEILSGDAYLVVECKCKGRVSAKDVVRFINRVDELRRHLPEVWFEKPPLYAYLCHAGEVDKDASVVAKSHSIKFLRIER